MKFLATDENTYENGPSRTPSIAGWKSSFPWGGGWHIAHAAAAATIPGLDTTITPPPLALLHSPDTEKKKLTNFKKSIV